MFFTVYQYCKKNSVYQPFQTNVTILHHLRIPTWSVIYCSLMTMFEFLCSLLDWCSWKTLFSASLKDFFLKWTYLKVLAWRYKVSILPSKFRESSSADSPFAELRRWEKREQILEFIMNEETIWCTSIFYFFFETDLKKTVNNTIRIVGWWIWRVFFC